MGKVSQEGRENLLLKGLNLRCLGSNRVKTNAWQVGRRSELPLTEVSGQRHSFKLDFLGSVEGDVLTVLYTEPSALSPPSPALRLCRANLSPFHIKGKQNPETLGIWAQGHIGR